MVWIYFQESRSCDVKTLLQCMCFLIHTIQRDDKYVKILASGRSLQQLIVTDSLYWKKRQIASRISLIISQFISSRIASLSTYHKFIGWHQGSSIWPWCHSPPTSPQPRWLDLALRAAVRFGGGSCAVRETSNTWKLGNQTVLGDCITHDCNLTVWLMKLLLSQKKLF